MISGNELLKSRIYSARFGSFGSFKEKGLTMRKILLAVPQYEINGKTVYRLVFGEIDGAADMDEDIVLNWPDGSKDVTHYHCSDHREGRHPKCNRSWELNGSEHEGNTFRFSGKSLPK